MSNNSKDKLIENTLTHLSNRALMGKFILRLLAIDKQLNMFVYQKNL